MTVYGFNSTPPPSELLTEGLTTTTIVNDQSLIEQFLSIFKTSSLSSTSEGLRLNLSTLILVFLCFLLIG